MAVEENKDSGFIPLWRSVFTHWVWDNPEPFDKRSAWIDLLRSAEIEPRTTMQDGKLIHLKRGDIKASIRYLQQRWKWGSTSKVENFLELLRKESMITTQKIQGITVVTICKYSDYNDFEKPKNTQEIQQVVDEKDAENTQEIHRTDEVNNITIQQSNNETGDYPATSAGTIPEKKAENLGEDFILDEKHREGYIAATRFVLQNANIKKLEKQLSPKEYEKLKEAFTDEQILEVLAIMENSKSIKNKKSVYLTTLTIAKANFGNAEAQKNYDKFESRYKEFILKQSQGSATAKMDSYEKRALRSIINYLFENSVTNNYEGAFKSFDYILNKWSNLDQFMQGRIKCQEIDKDIVKIISTLKNGNNKNNPSAVNKGTSTGSERKDFES